MARDISLRILGRSCILVDAEAIPPPDFVDVMDEKILHFNEMSQPRLGHRVRLRKIMGKAWKEMEQDCPSGILQLHFLKITSERVQYIAGFDRFRRIYQVHSEVAWLEDFLHPSAVLINQITVGEQIDERVDDLKLFW